MNIDITLTNPELFYNITLIVGFITIMLSALVLIPKIIAWLCAKRMGKYIWKSWLGLHYHDTFKNNYDHCIEDVLNDIYDKTGKQYVLKDDDR